jgi:hypothetical protein
MPKIAYEEHRFQKRTKDLITVANGIIEEYDAEGMQLTLRQLYYQFVARNLIPNKPNEYDKLGVVIANARLAGLIDWTAIEDRTRNLKSLQHWKDPGQIIEAAYNSFVVDRWAGQVYRVEVWIEKEALVGVIADICEELDVPYFACRGHVSHSEMWSSAMRLQEYADRGQKTVILYLGDHDPSGMDITRDIRRRQEMFDGCYDIRRIALTMAQIEDHNPPPNPVKITDSRSNSYIADYGNQSWELDALEPRVLRNLIEHHVSELRDEKAYRKALRQEDKYKKVLQKVQKNWKTLLK